ncbi:MAG: radical SAM protein [Firmicutes bacterium]|nr:radical SAM protein [Bacillota bacterium]
MPHRNIPIFVPHAGCPNKCVFCDQRAIAGADGSGGREILERARKTLSDTFDGEPNDNSETQIAFFSGSFTGIDTKLMLELLELAESYISRGYASSVRFSTRPDYISPEILRLIEPYSVKTIELGIQSLSDEVLAASKRGCTALDSYRAAELIKSRGKYELIGQMMTGLPRSTRESELMTAKGLCDMGCDGARIYPTVVLKNTELCDMMESGNYRARGVSEAIEDAAAVYRVFLRRGVKVIRIGLCANDGLNDGSVAAGGYHAALGELVESRIFAENIVAELEKTALPQGDITVWVPEKCLSKAIGQHAENRNMLAKRYGRRFLFAESANLSGHEIKVT